MPDVNSRKKAVAFLVLRWLFVPILFYCFGGFLEGPPTRVVVRSFAFVFGCFSLSILAAQFLQQVRRIPKALSVLQALFIPTGYVYFAQIYYSGGKNQDYFIAIAIFFLLMMLNAAVYLNGLFVMKSKTTGTGDGETESEEEFGYEITLYNLDPEGQLGSVKLQKQVQGEEELPEHITVDGFSKNIAIDLGEHWDVFLDDDFEEYSAKVTTYETIVKFGETQQLVNDYQLVLKITQ